MLRDVFYYGEKPNVHPRERFAKNLEDARTKATTRDFWIINEFCDYRNFDWDFDFEFLPDEDVWAEDHNNVWPSQHQKDSGTWLCPKEHSDIIIYRADVNPVNRRNIKTDNWVELDLIDHTKFDFSWHPDPTDPPYIYKWGCKFFPPQFKHVLEYHVPGATQEKYMDVIAELLPEQDKWVEVQSIDKAHFDLSWRPNPLDPPFIYIWGNKYIEGKLKPTLEYHATGATDKKYMPELVPVLPDWNNWQIPKNVNTSGFDFSWRPDPREPDLIYEFSTQWQKTGGPRYVMPGATETKYLDTDNVIRLSSMEHWTIPDNLDTSSFDFSWHPDSNSPPYVYVFGTQWSDTGGPVYTVPGATEIKYIPDQTAIALPDRTNWIYDSTVIDADSFDFSWHPPVEDQPYVYQFGTQWQKTGGPKYIAPGADSSSPMKYVDTNILAATRLANREGWDIFYPIDDFDFSWHPDSTEEPYVYIFGNQWHDAVTMPTLEYRVDGATEIKYVYDTVARLASDMNNWVVPDKLDISQFDFSWRPEPGSPNYIYEFATQWQKTGGPQYHMHGATEKKYIDVQKAKRVASWENWTVPDNVDNSGFDLSWHPDDTSPPYIYVFPTQWAFSGGPVYTVPGATEIKYIDDQTAIAKVSMSNWEYNGQEIDVDSFDFSWHPYEEDQPYIYQFGTQWQKTGGPRYITPGASESSPVKYIDTRILKATRLPNNDNFVVVDGIRVREFDYSWHPDDTSPPYIYVFGNTQYPAEDMPTIEYRVPGATNVEYVYDPVAILDRNMSHWDIPAGVDASIFDFSWVPHPSSPPYVYQFGTLVDDVWVEDGPRYLTPGNDGFIVRLENSQILTTELVYPKYHIETTLEDLIRLHPTEMFWALNKGINYENFDFSWKPEKENLFNVTVFGSPDSETTQTYFVNAPTYLEGHTGLNFIQQDQEIDEKYLAELFVKPDMFYVDRGNKEARSRFDELKSKFGNRIQKTRYLNSWVDTVNRCINRSTTDLVWVLNSELDYTNFDFEYYPNPWQMKMVTVFGTQWSHWGTTFLVNRETFAEDTKYIKIIEHLPNLNFVKNSRALAPSCVHDIVVIDHGNIECSVVVDTLQRLVPDRTITTVEYDTSYVNTLKTIIKKQQEKKEHYIWICSSVCDYSTFDFSYICDPFAKDQLHVFPSGIQKFGDTFFVDVNKARELITDLDRLDEYNKINFNGSVKARRLPEPVIVTSDDTHVNAALNVVGFPYITLITSDNADVQVPEVEPMNLWSPESKNILVTSTGATRIVVPAEVKNHVKKELYDYPYIKRSPKLALSNPLDIVFLSNGETGAEENWEHLLNVTKGLKNRVVRVDGINGRVAAYHAAAEASETPWMFTVFAKLKVSPKFDWNWQPDRMQSPKHYIFHAKNPVNGLTYGHQAMIAYNKKLALANEGRGLDFTLDDEHEVVPLVSGTAIYNTDPFSTWRTAFREVIKLKADISDIAKDRLDIWLNRATGDFAQYSIKGALDADEYYDEVGGDFNQIKLSYEWDWLRDRFEQM